MNENNDKSPIEFEPTTTRVDIVPHLVDEDRIRLELRLEWVGFDSSPAAENAALPKPRRQRLDTGFEMTLGHTIAVAASPGKFGESKQGS